MAATKANRRRPEPLPAGWEYGRHERRRESLRLLPRRVRVLLASEWALSVLSVFEAKRPGDERPHKAIAAARDWAFGSKSAAAAAAAAAAYAAAGAGLNAAYAAAAAARAAAAAAYADTGLNTAYAADAAAASADAANCDKKWRWIYDTYRAARGPIGVTFDPAWRTAAAVGLARAIAADRAFDRLPILADALEEAGCGDAGVLAGLREDRGEWTLADWSLWNLLGLETGGE